jgi:hypothetical protein
MFQASLRVLLRAFSSRGEAVRVLQSDRRTASEIMLRTWFAFTRDEP